MNNTCLFSTSQYCTTLQYHWYSIGGTQYILRSTMTTTVHYHRHCTIQKETTPLLGFSPCKTITKNRGKNLATGALGIKHAKIHRHDVQWVSIESTQNFCPILAHLRHIEKCKSITNTSVNFSVTQNCHHFISK